MAKYSLDETIYLRAIIYGDSGSGKTTLATSALLDERSGPILVLNNSGNPQSGLIHEVPFDLIEIHQLRSLNDPFNWIVKGQPANSRFVRDHELENHADNNPFKMLIIDQITDLQIMAFREILKEPTIQPGNLGKKREWDHYRSGLDWSRNFAKTFFQHCPIHLIMLAQESYHNDKGKMYPAIDGQARDVIPGQASAVWRLMRPTSMNRQALRQLEIDKDETLNVLFTEEIGDFLAKTQYPEKPMSPMILNPTMTKIFDSFGIK